MRPFTKYENLSEKELIREAQDSDSDLVLELAWRLGEGADHSDCRTDDDVCEAEENGKSEARNEISDDAHRMKEEVFELIAGIEKEAEIIKIVEDFYDSI